MISNEVRYSKKSKDAQAERILQSLSQKTRSCLHQNSKKIKKKKKLVLDDSIQLVYKSKNGHKKFIDWIMPKSSVKIKESTSKVHNVVPSKKFESDQSGSHLNEEVNYAAIFESAYEDLKSESSLSKNARKVQQRSHGVTPQVRVNDGYSGIEYDPVDNYFYLVSNNNSSKKQFFRNKAISGVKQTPCIVINPRIIEGLKKSFELDSFLC
jgi:hypothetical protein